MDAFEVVRASAGGRWSRRLGCRECPPNGRPSVAEDRHSVAGRARLPCDDGVGSDDRRRRDRSPCGAGPWSSGYEGAEDGRGLLRSDRSGDPRALRVGQFQRLRACRLYGGGSGSRGRMVGFRDGARMVGADCPHPSGTAEGGVDSRSSRRGSARLAGRRERFRPAEVPRRGDLRPDRPRPRTSARSSQGALPRGSARTKWRGGGGRVRLCLGQGQGSRGRPGFLSTVARVSRDCDRRNRSWSRRPGGLRGRAKRCGACRRRGRWRRGNGRRFAARVPGRLRRQRARRPAHRQAHRSLPVSATEIVCSAR